ncbi:MAG: ABC transporter permease [Vicinamibacterales bacterium]
MRDFFTDLRFAVRGLARSRAFTAAALLTLAIGIGANAAIFSVLDALMLKPLPYPDPERLVVIWEKNIPRQRMDNVVSPGNYIHWSEQARVFERMAGVGQASFFRMSITGGSGDPEELPAQSVTVGFFPILGVRPAHGRWFLPEEDKPDTRVAILSHALWTRRFGADPAIVGRAVTLNGNAFTVVGIMPPEFFFIEREAALWVTIGLRAEARTPRGRWMLVTARMKPGVTVQQAQAEMDTITTRLTAQFPEFNTGWGANVVPLHRQVVGRVRPAVLTLAAAVGAVLLIACANVANLLLARGASRRRELAVRAALGAGRGRLVRQLLAESMALAAIGAVAGLLLAWWGIATFRAAATAGFSLPRAHEIALNARVVLFTIGLSLVTAILFGLAPAFAAAGVDLQNSLKDGARADDARGGRLRSLLVVSEIAIALVLLAGAGLLIRSFARLVNVDPGFRAEQVLSAKISIPTVRYDDTGKMIRFFDELVKRVEAMPGVRAAGGVSFLPLAGPAAATGFEIEGREKPPLGASPVCEVRVATGHYFGAMGIPHIAGRQFDERDSREGTRTVIINQTMARQYWPNESPIGKRISVSWNNPGLDEIVGVVGDVRHATLETASRPMIYYPPGRFAYPWMALVLRAAGDPAPLGPALVKEVHAMDPALPVADLRPMETVVSRAVAERRMVMAILAGFALVAALLAAIGIYGVMAYSVAQRTREIGVRMALGARPGDIMRLVLGRALGLTAIGAVIGAAGAIALTRFTATLLFDTEPTEPAVFATVVAGLASVALAASLLPGRAAARVDPLIALRAE